MTSTALTKPAQGGALAQSEEELLQVLGSSLYPGAAPASIRMVLGYCRAAGLDPMAKPVHIVPMWDSKTKAMRDVIMPGVGSYRTAASRTGQFAGMTEPEFGPDVTEKIGGFEITFPQWARVTVERILPSGHVAKFSALEYWRENYAVKGGPEKSVAPNAMWQKRPRGQLGKCAQAQALRVAFPELGAQPTVEEMEGRPLHDVEDADVPQAPVITLTDDQRAAWDAAAGKGQTAAMAFWKSAAPEFRRAATQADRDHYWQIALDNEKPAAQSEGADFVAGMEKVEAEEANAYEKATRGS